jgi:hypothetical protein
VYLPSFVWIAHKVLAQVQIPVPGGVLWFKKCRAKHDFLHKGLQAGDGISGHSLSVSHSYLFLYGLTES